jgi:hypothetical protein
MLRVLRVAESPLVSTKTAKSLCLFIQRFPSASSDELNFSC